VLFCGILVIALGCILVMPLLPWQEFNLFKLSWINELVSVTLLFSLLFLAENVIKIVDYIIKNSNKRFHVPGVKWSSTQGKLMFSLFNRDIIPGTIFEKDPAEGEKAALTEVQTAEAVTISKSSTPNIDKK
jgi:hypothetical protein